jgi:hypothetical protein
MRRGFGDDGWWGEDQTSSVLSDSLALVRVLNGSRSAVDVLGAQRALNRLPSSQARLVVDGRFGQKTQARLNEYLGRSTGGINVIGSAINNLPRSTGGGGGLPDITRQNPPPPKSSSTGLYLMLVLAVVLAVTMKD